jgi:2-haloacid dehalogenase
MPRIIVFDVNETLLDVQSLAPHFATIFGDASSLREWFSLLLLHSEAATLAGPYFDFATLAGAALDMMGASRSIAIRDTDRGGVLDAMLRLPPHPEVRQALEFLRASGLRLVTLTNSSAKAVEQQVRNAGLADLFERNFSVDTVQRYKPAPEPYRMVASEMKVAIGDLRLVAAHSWDILGAMRVGCAAAFVERPGKVLFPLVPKPDVSGKDLMTVAEQIARRESAHGS